MYQPSLSSCLSPLRLTEMGALQLRGRTQDRHAKPRHSRETAGGAGGGEDGVYMPHTLTHATHICPGHTHTHTAHTCTCHTHLHRPYTPHTLAHATHSRLPRPIHTRTHHTHLDMSHTCDSAIHGVPSSPGPPKAHPLACPVQICPSSRCQSAGLAAAGRREGPCSARHLTGLRGSSRGSFGSHQRDQTLRTA